MNYGIKDGKTLEALDSRDILQPPSAISNLFALAGASEDQTLKMSQNFTVHQFDLGGEILINDLNLSVLTQHSVQDEQNSKLKNTFDFYLVCQGQVRLLCQTSEQRETTALLLGTNEAFGADLLFCETAELLLPYRAIAASSVQVARVSADTLGRWLKQFPQLGKHLLQQTQLRQRLIFFKTCTALRSIPSQQLKKFVPHLSEQTIPSGASLAELAPGTLGRFWLRQGEVTSPETPLPLAIGSHWGYSRTNACCLDTNRCSSLQPTG